MRPVVIAHVSDMHAGGATALCPPKITLDDGGVYVASKLQRWLFQCWEDYWQRVAKVRKLHKAELYVIFNGDLVEGHHHSQSQLVATNPNAQAAILTEVITIPLAQKPERIFVVRGTEAHGGTAEFATERIADGLRKNHDPIVGDPDTGTASWWHLRMAVGKYLLDITHHGRTGQREHTRGSQAVLHAHDILLSHVKSKHRPPDLCLRAHHHKFNDSWDACAVRVVTSGAFQYPTGHVKKVAPDSITDIGGLIVVVTEEAYTVEKVHFLPESRGAVWRSWQSA